MKSNDVGSGAVGGGAMWVYPSPVTTPTVAQQRTRVCRVASIFTAGQLGHSNAQASSLMDVVVFAGMPGASRVLVIRVYSDGQCSKYDRIKGFAYVAVLLCCVAA